MIIVCGEALIDLVDEGAGRFRALPGGSPANVAVGLARLGVPTAMLARLGDDVFGRLLRHHLLDNGVDLALAPRASEPTTLAVVSLDEAGVATYDFYVEGTADWQWTVDDVPHTPPPGCTTVHTGSLAMALPPGSVVLTELLRRVREEFGLTVSYDPNVRPRLEGDPVRALARVTRQLRLADVVKVSDQDLAWLMPGRDPVEVAREWAGDGPCVVVVTRGPDGAVGVTAGGACVTRPAPPVPVVDTVGAGDAFTAGMLAALHRRDLLGPAGRPALAAMGGPLLAQVLDEAALVAALTCGRPGADPPTADEVAAAAARGGG